MTTNQNIFCPECGMMKTYIEACGERICTNERCFSNCFARGNFVVSRRHRDLGVGKVIDEKEEKFIVKFDSKECKLSKLDLEHYILDRKTQVETSFGCGIIVESLKSPSNNSLEYRVLLPSGERIISESAILKILPGSPIDKLLNNQIDSPIDYYLKNRALFYRSAQSSDEFVCIYNSRVDLMPHQVGVAHRAIQDYNPRFLLADEPGLGKTIEAGLIMKELKARGLARRVLIITPANLVNQWEQEMRTKFNERFEVFDNQTESYYAQNFPDENPYANSDNVLCSLQFARLRDRPERLAREFWDLIIFDEAHHLRGDRSYTLAEKLKERCNALLLLTATPMQLRDSDFYLLIELLDPTLFGNYEKFQWYNNNILPLIKSLIELSGNEELTLEQAKGIIHRLSEISGLPAIEAPFSDQVFDGENIKEKLKEALRECILVNRIMMRNRKRDVFPDSPERIVTTVSIDYSPEERELYNEITEYIRNEYNRARMDNDTVRGFTIVIFQKMLTSSKYAVLESFKKKIKSLRDGERKTVTKEEINEYDEMSEKEQDELFERSLSANEAVEIEKLEYYCKRIEEVKVDSKLDGFKKAIAKIFCEKPDEKILIFTQFITTQMYLKKELEKEGYSVVIFNGKMAREEKDEAVRSFKDEKQIMISTEAGGEGRNLQFAHIMFNYDLPWNPMKLEQRIGRLDRIGQKRNVLIYNLATFDTLEERVLKVLYERVEAIKEIMGDIEPVLGDIVKEVEQLIMSQKEEFDKKFEKFERTLDEKLREAKEIEKRLEDFVMDTRPFNYETVEQILGKKPTVGAEELRDFVCAGIRHLEGSMEEIEKDVYEIKLPPAFRVNQYRSKYRGTFNQKLARNEEGLEFFAFGHEVVDALLRRFGDVTQPVASVFEAIEKKGVLFSYYVELKGLVDKSFMIPIFIGEDMKFDEELSKKYGLNLLQEKRNISEISFINKIKEMEAKSREELQRMLKEKVEREREKHNTMYRKEENRIEALYQLKKDKLNNELNKEKELLERMERSEDEEQKKIIPALKGKIDKLNREIESLIDEKQRKLERLKKMELMYNYHLSSVGVFA